MYCQKCGAQVDDQVAFCDKCGASLQEANPTTIIGAAASPEAVQYAGFGKRLGAFFIDQFIMQIPFVLVLPIIIIAGVFVENSWVEAAIVYSVFIMYLAVYLLYGPLMESSRRQATLGKQALGIVVTDIDKNRVSFAKALGRNVGKIVSALIYYVGFFMIAFTAKRQGLHDIMAGCLVAKKEVGQQ